MKQEMLINPPEDELDRTVLQLLQPGVWLREKVVSISHRHVIVSAIIPCPLQSAVVYLGGSSAAIVMQSRGKRAFLHRIPGGRKPQACRYSQAGLRHRASRFALDRPMIR